MRLMTPTEYADAYRYSQQQGTRAERTQVEDLIDQRTVHMRSEVVRLAALARWPESDRARRARQLVLMSDNPRRRVA